MRTTRSPGGRRRPTGRRSAPPPIRWSTCTLGWSRPRWRRVTRRRARLAPVPRRRRVRQVVVGGRVGVLVVDSGLEVVVRWGVVPGLAVVADDPRLGALAVAGGDALGGDVERAGGSRCCWSRWPATSSTWRRWWRPAPPPGWSSRCC
jgi:hypothetical protein